jgi:hypothetical protein
MAGVYLFATGAHSASQSICSGGKAIGAPSGVEVYNAYSFTLHVKWVPCHHGMARPQVADGGEGLQIWKVAANILSKQSRTADKPRPSSLGVGRGANNSPP